MLVERIDVAGETVAAADALARIGLEPVTLGPKEGLALINGTQASTAIALDVLFTTERIFASALVSGALSLDALKGTVFYSDYQGVRFISLDSTQAMGAASREAQTAWLEQACDEVNGELPNLKSFVLPGGTPAVCLKVPSSNFRSASACG